MNNMYRRFYPAPTQAPTAERVKAAAKAMSTVSTSMSTSSKVDKPKKDWAAIKRAQRAKRALLGPPQ